MNYQLNPLLLENWKTDLIKHPEIIKKELDPVKRSALKKLRHKLIVGRKVSKAIAKGPDAYVSYGPDNTKIFYSVIPGESEVSKWRRLPRPWARSNWYDDKSIVTKVLGRYGGHEFLPDSVKGKYKKGPKDPYGILAKKLKDNALKNGNLDQKISHRDAGSFVKKISDDSPYF